jgi:hypothetical protein
MIVRCNSHRSREKLLEMFPVAIAYYNHAKLFHDKSKGYYLIPDSGERDALRITGVSKPKDQNLDNYGQCWTI